MNYYESKEKFLRENPHMRTVYRSKETMKKYFSSKKVTFAKKKYIHYYEKD